MKAVKRLTPVLCGLLFTAFLCPYEARAQKAQIKEAQINQTEWNIENKADKSTYAPKDEVLLSVYIKNSDTAAQQEITSLNGTLEYDTSLFTADIASLIPVEGGKIQSVAFDGTNGGFQVNYGAAATVKQGGLLLQLKLRVAQDASFGRTTICVTLMEWNTKEGGRVSVEHRVPVKITIAQPGLLTGDVNGDGKVNLADAKLVMQYCNGKKKLNGRQKKSADVNGDGKVNLTDAKLIMKYYHGEIKEFYI